MITSIANPQIKELLQLQKKSKARNEKSVFVEGVRCSRRLKDRIEKVYLSESFEQKRGKEMNLSGLPVEVLSDKVFSHVSDTKTPQGILCLVKQKKVDLSEMLEKTTPFLMVLDNLQDPGNLGTIVRTAEGAGVTGIIMSRDTVDIYNPKTIRSTMGSVYRMPFFYVEDILEFLEDLRRQGIRTYARHLDGANNYDEESYRRLVLFLLGMKEMFRDEVAKKADIWIKIPMYGQVESLNAAIASSILMYEVSRQRRK